MKIEKLSARPLMAGGILCALIAVNSLVIPTIVSAAAPDKTAVKTVAMSGIASDSSPVSSKASAANEVDADRAVTIALNFMKQNIASAPADLSQWNHGTKYAENSTFLFSGGRGSWSPGGSNLWIVLFGNGDTDLQVIINASTGEVLMVTETTGPSLYKDGHSPSKEEVQSNVRSQVLFESASASSSSQ